MSDLVPLLRPFPLFRGLSDAELQTIGQCMGKTQLEAAGMRLFEQGQRSGGAFLIQRGGLRLDLVREGEAPLAIAELGPGSAVGELSLVADAPRSLRATTTGPSEFLWIDVKRFTTLRSRNSAAAYTVIRNICTSVCGQLRNSNTFIEAELRGEAGRVVSIAALPVDVAPKARGLLSRWWGR